MEGAGEAIKALDGKIAEREGELERLRQLQTQVEADLQTLRQARNLLVGEEPPPKPLRRARDLPLEEEAPPQPLRKARDLPLEEEAFPKPARKARDLLPVETAPPPSPDGIKRGEDVPPPGRSVAGSRQGPLRLLVLEILREAGKPLHVDELVARLRAAGKPADSAIVAITLADHIKSGKIYRTPQDTYGLPKGFGL